MRTRFPKYSHCWKRRSIQASPTQPSWTGLCVVRVVPLLGRPLCHCLVRQGLERRHLPKCLGHPKQLNIANSFSCRLHHLHIARRTGYWKTWTWTWMLTYVLPVRLDK